jgi:hypothetical protein
MEIWHPHGGGGISAENETIGRRRPALFLAPYFQMFRILVALKVVSGTVAASGQSRWPSTKVPVRNAIVRDRVPPFPLFGLERLFRIDVDTCRPDQKEED